MQNVIQFRPRPKPPRPGQAQAEFREAIEVAAQAAMDTAERLIAILDQMDGDPDAEDDGTAEPTLASPEALASQIIWIRGGDRDHEATSPEFSR